MHERIYCIYQIAKWAVKKPAQRNIFAARTCMTTLRQITTLKWLADALVQGV